MSSKKIYFISDYFIEDMTGGASLCDEELCRLLGNRVELQKIRSRDLDLKLLLSIKEFPIIISNFLHIHSDLLYFIKESCTYVHYAHDYKFVSHTNPNLYADFKVPSEDIINAEFYYNAIATICQSSLQERIYNQNLGENVNTLNISGNFWASDSLNIFKDLCLKPKNGKVAIVDSPYPQKGVKESKSYCCTNDLDYDVISDSDNLSFLNKLAGYSKLCFFPSTPETLCRLVIEAKMLGLEIITNKLVGASYEPWYNKKGIELTNYLEKFKIIASDIILNLIYGK